MKKYASRVDHDPVTEEETGAVNIIEIKVSEMSGKLSLDPQED